MLPARRAGRKQGKPASHGLCAGGHQQANEDGKKKPAVRNCGFFDEGTGEAFQAADSQ